MYIYMRLLLYQKDLELAEFTVLGCMYVSEIVPMAFGGFETYMDVWCSNAV